MLLIKEIGVLEIQGHDELRCIWIEVPRGTIEDFGEYEEFLEEDVVSNYEEFVEMWKRRADGRDEGLTMLNLDSELCTGATSLSFLINRQKYFG